ncbi:MIP/aquaporin family protein [Flavivirga jejuensis]|uniref:MIP/aquaporin family protein n=1 Tax=Flavivirga jejuensis TaxID=870487 RepID=A0ABT8WKG5_9FLAO|nr:MIP/aquaporin family protein [Flavivirga jejuensis]MDO5973656.1 MIP/aquaporin family protein [Flavivirga jejuensis]
MNILLGELFGTMILVLLGNGVVANCLLSESKANGSGWMVISSGWAFAVLVGVFVALAFGAPAHINPAVTIGFAVSSGDFSNVIPFISAQFIGAFLGGLLVYLHFGPHWKATENAGLKLACFSTGPAIRKTSANIISEAIGTFVLVLGVAAIFDSSGRVSDGLGPFLVAGLVWGIGLSLGGTTGYAINPARDFAPRLVHAILPIPGKGSSDFAYSWIPVVGPIIGGVLAGLFIIFFPVF